MKNIDCLVHKRCIFHIIFIISLLVVTSCERNNNKTIIEDESIENPDTNNDSREEFYPIDSKERTPGLSYDDLEPETPPVSRSNNDLVYRYNGIMSMRFGEYFELHDGSELKTSEEESRM